MDLNNPVFQAVIGPFVVAFLVVGASRLVVWPTGSEVLAGLGLAAGLLMAFVQLRGIPLLPPNSAPEKLFYLITLGGLIGVALDLLGRPALIGRLAFVFFPAICLAWFSLRQLLAGPDVWLLIKLVLMWAGAAIVLWQICVATARCGALPGAAVLLFGRWRLDHRAHSRFTALVRQQRTKQRLAIDTVGLRSTPSTRCRNRGRIDDMAFNSFTLQRAMNPEAVQPGFLNDNDRE